MVQQNRREHAVALPYKPSGVTIKWLPAGVKQFDTHIETQAKRYNVDANLVAILMTLESGGYTRADSGFATGLMQIAPLTASDIAKKHLKSPLANYDLFNVSTSIEFGVAYIAWLRDTLCDWHDAPSWNDCAEGIAAGYNGGPGAAGSLLRGEGLTAEETQIYSRNALNMWRERNSTKSPTYQRWYDAGGKILVQKAAKEMTTKNTSH